MSAQARDVLSEFFSNTLPRQLKATAPQVAQLLVAHMKRQGFEIRKVGTEPTKVWTDGSCLRNPGGPGGYAYLIQTADGRNPIQGGGNDPSTTNNRMELMAAIAALETLDEETTILVHTDSTYVRDGITRWIHSWRKEGWMRNKGKPVKNADLWQRLDELCAARDVRWKWIKAHNGNPMNEKVDAMAKLRAKACA